MGRGFRAAVFKIGLVFAAVLPIGAFAQSSAPFDSAHVTPYFDEAKKVSEKEGGKLWGQTLYGPILFVDGQTNSVIANQQDAEGRLHKNGNVFEGKLTDDVAPSNSPIKWSGTRWTMLIWQYLAEDRLTREKLFAHEMFHRIQPSLKLDAPDSLNLQLDSADGRTWMQLEWRALAAALVESGPAQNQAIKDALAFRDRRHKLFSGSAESESSLEIAEGVPEYTGVAAVSPDAGVARWYTISRLTSPDLTISFVRSFAYTSGPAYGLLLDQRLPGWRKKLNTKSDLGALLSSTVKGSVAQADTRAATYGADAIRVTEKDRSTKIEAIKVRYRKLLVDGPTLTFPSSGDMNFTFNPSSVISLDEHGAVYPTFHVKGPWGVLNVTDGALRPKDLSNVTVAAPVKTSGSHIEGQGWTLELASGWRVIAKSESNNFTVQKN